tara:strand:+ start:631 stop:1506 length:876 start_codon:yes stop_codon:yes gene_type:complete
MKITNNYNLPRTLVALAQRDEYSKGDSDYSVTEIISPPRIQCLRRKHRNKLKSDVSDMLWSMMGTALHSIAEKSKVKHHINEERLKVEIQNVTLSGAIDIQKISQKKVEIIDYKFCGVYSVQKPKPEWEAQLNIYGWLVNKTKGLNIESLQICAMLRDWSRRNSLKSVDYPEASVVVIDYPVWQKEKTEEYIKDRIEIHQSSKFKMDMGESLPLCTDEERWKNPDKWAVMKTGQKRAIKLFDSQDDAEKIKNEKGGGHYVEKRISEPIRCTGNYCGVSEWCTQYSKESAIS